jgi:ferredoxin-NADP reductase
VYSNKTKGEIAYTDIFDQGYDAFGLKTVCTLTDLDYVPPDWPGYTGFVNADMLVREIPDYRERTFYVSGPNSLVKAAEKMLGAMGIPRRQIKTDFFPGFA